MPFPEAKHLTPWSECLLKSRMQGFGKNESPLQAQEWEQTCRWWRRDHNLRQKLRERSQDQHRQDDIYCPHWVLLNMIWLTSWKNAMQLEIELFDFYCHDNNTLLYLIFCAFLSWITYIFPGKLVDDTRLNYDIVQLKFDIYIYILEFGDWLCLLS